MNERPETPARRLGRPARGDDTALQHELSIPPLVSPIPAGGPERRAWFLAVEAALEADLIQRTEMLLSVGMAPNLAFQAVCRDLSDRVWKIQSVALAELRTRHGRGRRVA